MQPKQKRGKSPMPTNQQPFEILGENAGLENSVDTSRLR